MSFAGPSYARPHSCRPPWFSRDQFFKLMGAGEIKTPPCIRMMHRCAKARTEEIEELKAEQARDAEFRVRGCRKKTEIAPHGIFDPYPQED